MLGQAGTSGRQLDEKVTCKAASPQSPANAGVAHSQRLLTWESAHAHRRKEALPEVPGLGARREAYQGFLNFEA